MYFPVIMISICLLIIFQGYNLLSKRRFSKTNVFFSVLFNFIFLCLIIGIYIFKRLNQATYLSIFSPVISLISKYNTTPIESDNVLIILVGLVSLVITSIIYLATSIKIKKDFQTQTNAHSVKVITVTENMIFFEANKKGKITSVNDAFFDYFKDQRLNLDFKKIVKTIFVNNTEYKYKDYLKALSKANYDPYCSLKIILKDDKEVEIELHKVERIKNNKIIGYDIVNRVEEMTETAKIQAMHQSKQKIINILNLISSPMAIYDDSRNCFLLTNSFLNLLERDYQEMDYEEFRSLVLQDDLIQFNNIIFESRINRNSFRLLTKNGYLWFERRCQRIDNIDYTLITESQKGLETSVKPYSYSEMVRDIDRCFKSQMQFAICIISFKNIKSITHGLRNGLSDDLINKYFEKLGKKLNIFNLKTYKFGDIEYGILFENYEEYSLVLRGLKNQTSILLSTDIYINEARFNLTNKVGICESSQIRESNPENMIKGCLEALDICSDVNYPNDYSIFFGSKTKKNVSLVDYNLNFDDDYLDSIYKVK